MPAVCPLVLQALGTQARLHRSITAPAELSLIGG